MYKYRVLQIGPNKFQIQRKSFLFWKDYTTTDTSLDISLMWIKSYKIADEKEMQKMIAEKAIRNFKPIIHKVDEE